MHPMTANDSAEAFLIMLMMFFIAPGIAMYFGHLLMAWLMPE